jgi:RNA polymerase sigma factor (sigma-70 family)
MSVLANEQDALIRIGQGDRRALERVYQVHRAGIFHYVLRHGGTWQDAQDIYQDVMLAFHANVMTGRLSTLTGKLSTYLYRLAANQWHTHLRTTRRWVGAEVLTEQAEDVQSDAPTQDAWLQRLIACLDERCQRILYLFYFERLSMRDVARQAGLLDADSAKKRKCDCLAKLRRLAEQHPDLAADLF